jgi:hypothetical protein
MAKTTTTRASRILKTQAAIDAENNAAAQKAARESNSAALTNAVRDVIGAYVATENATATAKTAWETAQETQRTKLEETYVALAKLSHENSMTVDMVRDTLHAALVHFYGEDRAKSGVGTVAKLRAQLARAMHPKVRAAVPAIIQPWADAWEQETAAIAAERAAAEAESRPIKPVPTPIRDKFDNRGGAVTQALQLARGAEAKLNQKGDKVIAPAVPSVVCAKPADVLSWVSAHPRVKRGATTPGSAPAPTGTPREIARARVSAIVDMVKSLAADYPAALDTIQPVLDALVHVTGDRLVPATLAPSAADKPLVAKPAPAEPVAGAAQLDDAIDPKMMARFAAFMKMMNGK